MPGHCTHRVHLVAAVALLCLTTGPRAAPAEESQGAGSAPAVRCEECQTTLSAGAAASRTALGWIFDTSNYPPRWRCGRWSAAMGWLHIGSDLAIFAAYIAIPCVLAFFVIRRRDTPFLPIFWLFAAFIFFCGFGHLVEAVIFWRPVYGFSGVIKLCTAIVSWATVLVLIPIIPRAMNLPGMFEMKQANQRLQEEIERRKAFEHKLHKRARELQRTNDELERFATSVDKREQRVVQLKEEVNALLVQIGREPAYLQESPPA